MDLCYDRRSFTADEFAKMQTDSPTELVQGVVVEFPLGGVRHGVVCGNTSYALRAWTRPIGHGIVACGSGVITERDPDSVRGPDVLFVSRQRWPHDQAPEGFLEVAPDLAVEVLSTNDVWKDVLTKTSEYFDAGVREVWVVDPDLKTVQVFRPDKPPRTLRASDMIESDDVLPGFSCPVDDFFIGA